MANLSGENFGDSASWGKVPDFDSHLGQFSSPLPQTGLNLRLNLETLVFHRFGGL